jgi:probable rRNA maturation factor
MEPPSSSFASILNESGFTIDEALLENAVQVALKRHHLGGRAVAILLTGDEELLGLNQQYRGIAEPTDVLTFPAVGQLQGNPLGDVAISVPYAQKQADRRKVSLDQEVAYLGIHGALHLAGFDDETEDDQLQMVAEMNACAKLAGLPSDEPWYSLLHDARSGE